MNARESEIENSVLFDFGVPSVCEGEFCDPRGACLREAVYVVEALDKDGVIATSLKGHFGVCYHAGNPYVSGPPVTIGLFVPPLGLLWLSKSAEIKVVQQGP